MDAHVQYACAHHLAQTLNSDYSREHLSVDKTKSTQTEISGKDPQCLTNLLQDNHYKTNSGPNVKESNGNSDNTTTLDKEVQDERKSENGSLEFNRKFESNEQNTNGSEGSIGQPQPSQSFLQSPLTGQGQQRTHTPLTQREVQTLKVLAVICCFLFPPTGAAAAFWAFRAGREFSRGGAQEQSTAANRSCILIFVSVVLCLMAASAFCYLGFNNYEDVIERRLTYQSLF